ncbi:MAG: enediyne biosynthesis thioesterase [Myxococcota bacterium]|jgi:enediyne biosynthesis thioesterase
MPIEQDAAGRFFAYNHVVSFSETNIVGNVYYAHHVMWQGRCREMFLRDHAPDVIDSISSGLALITLKVSCEYHTQLYAFDEVTLRMRVGWVRQNRMALRFDYWRGEERIATGEQHTACMQLQDGHLRPCPWPESMLQAIERYQLMAS